MSVDQSSLKRKLTTQDDDEGGKFHLQSNERTTKKMTGIAETGNINGSKSAEQNLLLTVPWEIQCLIFEFSDDLCLMNVMLSDRNLFENSAGHVLRQRNLNLSSLSIYFYPKCIILSVKATAVVRSAADQEETIVLRDYHLKLESKESEDDDQNDDNDKINEQNGRHLCGLFYMLLTNYDVSDATIEIQYRRYKAERIIPLPLDSFFEGSEGNFAIHELNISVKEFVPIINWICPRRLKFDRPSAELFNERGQLMMGGVEHLEIGTYSDMDDVDNVDMVMERCTCSEIVLEHNAYWSEQSAAAVFKKHADSGRQGVRTTIWCSKSSYVPPSYRRAQDWEKIVSNWSSSHAAANGGRAGRKITAKADHSFVVITLH